MYVNKQRLVLCHLKVECVAGDEVAVRSELFRFIWCQCRIVCVLYEFVMFFRTGFREDMPHWLSLLGQMVQIWIHAMFFYASSQLYSAVLVRAGMNM